jgi:hypothetical protein
MFTLPPIADIDCAGWNVRYVPKADIMQRNKLREQMASYLFDPLIGHGEHCGRDGEAERL